MSFVVREERERRGWKIVNKENFENKYKSIEFVGEKILELAEKSTEKKIKKEGKSNEYKSQ